MEDFTGAFFEYGAHVETETIMTHQITVDPGLYSADISLAWNDNTLRGCWVTGNDKEAWIHRKALDVTEQVDERIKSPSGAPADPQWIGSTLVWTEYVGTIGKLYNLDTDIPSAGPEPVPGEVFSNVGASRLCRCDGERLVGLLEDWSGDHPVIRSFKKNGTEWSSGDVLSGDSFAVRPSVITSGDTLWCCWDQQVGAHRHVVVGQLTKQGSDFVELPALPVPDGAEEQLGQITVDEAGSIYCARCQENLVEDSAGARWQSRLTLSCWNGNEWEEIGVWDLDDTMNPWLAAYCGFRRFPHFIQGDSGPWLMWEEKRDKESMEPSLGRLRGTPLAGAISQQAYTLHKDAAHYILADRASEGCLTILTKTQKKGFEWSIPLKLETIPLPGEQAIRNAQEPNASRPRFTIPDVLTAHHGSEDGDYRLYFGDPHCHSRYSLDLDGEADELFHFARETAGLDFVVFTENDCTRFTEPLLPANRLQSWRLADRYNEPGRFTAFRAWEYTLHVNPKWPKSVNSHRSVLFADTKGVYAPCHHTDVPTPLQLAQRCAGREDMLLHHHHPGAVDLSDASLERNIEICSGWWNCMRNPGFVNRLHGALRRGLPLGFFGASDNHERNPGLGGAITGIWATENSRAGIFEALRARRVFATTGLRPALTFTLNALRMGETGDIDGLPVLRVHVSCEHAPIEEITIFRDGEPVYKMDFDNNTADLEWGDSTVSPGQHFYYPHIRFRSLSDGVDWSKPMPAPFNLQPAFGVDAWASPILASIPE